MIRRYNLIPYGLFFTFLFALDRITKAWALSRLRLPQKVNDYIQIDVTFNRGISWGMFNGSSPFVFHVITGLILFTIVMLMMYATLRWVDKRSIVGEVMVLAGACSNVLDRFVYGGVVDFISLSYGDWVFPTFNVADVCIVLGVFLMLFTSLREPN